ncbi:hypothetical protein SFRA_001745 [Streptomyces xinghaiensis]|uniref:Uncharacterized protein n=1 Tax=Streptomyces xinghaiensis TaxID=1038928 RepID=A0A3R7LRX8_9ACTN|nr:hypothetical protein SFRA_001745 [Streptomyces xinghaiensis]RNC76121.1 hypothetical protein DC095_002630 [Streptomyces xinghaiensis]
MTSLEREETSCANCRRPPSSWPCWGRSGSSGAAPPWPSRTSSPTAARPATSRATTRRGTPSTAAGAGVTATAADTVAGATAAATTTATGTAAAGTTAATGATAAGTTAATGATAAGDHGRTPDPAPTPRPAPVPLHPHRSDALRPAALKAPG